MTYRLPMVTQPKVTPVPGGYNFDWYEQAEQVFGIRIRKVKEHKSSGTINAELSFFHIMDEVPPLEYLSISLKSTRSRADIVRKLSALGLPTDLNITEMVDQVCEETIRQIRAGEPAQELWTSDDLPPLQYMLKPLMIKGVPTMMFGEKGVAKSTMSLIAYMMLTLPWHDNPLGIEAPSQPVRAMVLDWEVPGYLAQLNLKKLQEGMKLPPLPLFHRHCRLPLADDIEPIQEIITTNKIEAVIIDSLGRAAGGDLSKDTEGVNSFFTALDSLNVTPLIIAQTSKDTESKKKTIYGSVFFTYYARSIFELAKSDMSDDDISVALFHRWCNLDRLHKPLGFRLSFTANTIQIEQQPVTYAEFKDKVGGKQQILEILAGGAKHIADISEEIESTKATTRVMLSQLKKRGKTIDLGDGLWGLKADEEK